MVESLIEHLGKEEIKLIFSGSFTNCLRNHLSSPHRFLNAAVKHLLNKIIKINDKFTNEVRFELLKQFYEVNKNIDGYSKVKVVENLIMKFDNDTIKKYIQFLKDELVKNVKKPHLEDEEEFNRDRMQEEYVHQHRSWILLRFIHLCRVIQSPDSEAFIKSIIRFFIFFIYFRVQKFPKTVNKNSILSVSDLNELEFIRNFDASEKLLNHSKSVLSNLLKYLSARAFDGLFFIIFF